MLRVSRTLAERVLVGFSPSFFLKVFFETPELPLYIHVHGGVLTAWFVVFFTQTLLIASRRPDLHRRLGAAGLLLAIPVVVASAVTTLLFIPHRLVGLVGPERALAFMAEAVLDLCVNIAFLLVFTIFVGSAAYYRRTPQIHKHFMLLASITIVFPAIDRIWRRSGVENAMDVWFPLSMLALVVTVIGSDWIIRRRPPWVLLGGLVGLIVLVGAAAGLSTTDTMRSWGLSLIS